MDEHTRPDEQEHYEAAEEGEAPIEASQPQPTVAQPQAHAKPAQPGAPTLWQRLKIFTKECVRVFRITKKPDRQEFMTVVKISGVGILIIGAIGFLVHMLGQLFNIA